MGVVTEETLPLELPSKFALVKSNDCSFVSLESSPK